MTITVECPHCGDNAQIPEAMNRYEWKSDTYSQATKSWYCWNCGEKITVKVSRHIFAAEVLRYVEDEQMSDEAKLLPCPFCGLDMELINIPWSDGEDCFEFRHSDENLAIKKNCPVAKEGYGAADDAVRAWNIRYEPRCIMKLIYLYDEEVVDGIECSECGWSGVHPHECELPEICPNCEAKVMKE